MTAIERLTAAVSLALNDVARGVMNPLSALQAIAEALDAYRMAIHPEDGA